MRIKTLRKKIRRLEARLQKGPKKLAKLRGKLEAMEAAKREIRAKGKDLAKASAQKPISVKRVKKKLNLSPERRAELSAVMKARWAAKRAAAEASPKTGLTGQDFALGQNLSNEGRGA
jgi:predicted  nucleic acid-binding Zn-ribbon protein